MNRRDFVRRVLGLGAVAAVAPLAAKVSVAATPPPRSALWDFDEWARHMARRYKQERWRDIDRQLRDYLLWERQNYERQSGNYDLLFGIKTT